MKKIICVLLISLFSVIGVFGLAACAVSHKPESSKPTDVVQNPEIDTDNTEFIDTTNSENTIHVYDLSNPTSISLLLNTDVDSLYQVKIGASIVQPNQYVFADKTLTIPTTVLGTDHYTDRKISVKYTQNADAVTFSFIFADKIIKTCDDFQNINDHLNWYYVLGADLDFQDFGNFNPIGNDGQKHGNYIGRDFTGKLIGAGHTISNLTANADEMTDEEIYTEHNVSAGAAPYETLRACFAVFLRNLGTIEDVCFKDCTVKNSYGTIMGMVAAVNEGTINNVLVDGGKVIGGDIWLDYNCFIAGFVGTNGNGCTISNCISTVTQIKADNNGTLARAFVGKTWGEIKNCYACNTGITFKDLKTGAINNQGIIGSASAPSLCEETGYGFGYIATESGTRKGSFVESYIISKDDMIADVRIYNMFDTEYWNIVDGEIPSLVVRYTAQ